MTAEKARKIAEMLLDPKMAVYGRKWFESKSEQAIYSIHLKWCNNKTRIKHGIEPKPIEELELEDAGNKHLDYFEDVNKKHFRINPETGEREVLTDSGNWEPYTD